MYIYICVCVCVRSMVSIPQDPHANPQRGQGHPVKLWLDPSSLHTGLPVATMWQNEESEAGAQWEDGRMGGWEDGAPGRKPHRKPWENDRKCGFHGTYS